ncbi:hypothetical protein SAMN06265222_104147 [Neorhodopirellula lusitana]|uniref:Uncharacterized protein n=1 Tax=Neorhodopirellula lusitana TaxID=445327 RepID=A0ABY1Q337_9BACT|nr:hypothetical protein SAMN06265222_104147 [Neorhodopirellula lusitana]
MLHQRSEYASCRRGNGHRPRRRLFLRRLSIARLRPTFATLGLLTLGLLSAKPAVAQPASVSLSSEQSRQSIQWLADQLVRHIPRTIDGDDDWGDTKAIWSGVKVRRDGWNIKTNRRHKDVNHGRWVRYQIDLPPIVSPQGDGVKGDSSWVVIHWVTPVRSFVPADQQSVIASPIASTSLPSFRSDVPGQLELNSARGVVTGVSTDTTPSRIDSSESPDSSGAINAWRMAASIATPADFYVRLQRWNRGLQVYSVSVRGKMSLSLKVQATISMQADFSEVPPAMQLITEVEKASISIDRFEVDRISKIGGDVAEELGDLAENTIGKVWLRKENKRLVSRLNQAIERNHDEMRWSMTDWFAQLTH